LFGYRSRVATAKRPGKAAIMRAAIEVMGEDGYEGASTRDMAARAGVSVAALYYHFPSKHDLLREFLDEAYEVTLARIERRAARHTGPVDQLDEIVGTIIWSALHDDFARRAAFVVASEYLRLDPPERAAIELKRKALLDLVEGVVRDGVKKRKFRSKEPREAARAIITLAQSVSAVEHEIGRPLGEVIALYQRFAVALVH
jgi:AcrR family transcriptional regulator